MSGNSNNRMGVLQKYNYFTKDISGKTTDIWSDELSKKFDKNDTSNITQTPQIYAATIDQISAQLSIPTLAVNNNPELTAISTAISNRMLPNPPPNTLAVFPNIYPFGIVDDQSGNSNIDKVKLRDLEIASDQFAELASTMYPDDFKGRDSAVLKEAFHSFFDFPSIDPTSIGMVSIKKLADLFDEHYMTYSGNRIDLDKFFKKFMENTELENYIDDNEISRMIQRLRTKISSIQIDDVYVFDPALWYGNTKGANDPFPNQFKDNLDKQSDSYGYFTRCPLLISMPGAPPTVAAPLDGIKDIGNGGAYTVQPVPELAVYNLLSGAYDTNGIFSIYSTDRSKIVCCLYQTGSDSSTNNIEIVSNYTYSADFNALTQAQLVAALAVGAAVAGGAVGAAGIAAMGQYYSQSIPFLLRLLNNSRNYYGNSNIFIKGTVNPLLAPAQEQHIISGQNIQLANMYPITQQTIQTGGKKKYKYGSKKIIRGGTVGNLFDTTGPPFVSAKKVGKLFNKNAFIKSIEKYNSIKPAVLASVGLVLNYSDICPMFIQTNTQRFTSNGTNLTFSDWANFFLFSSIVRTTLLLVSHFLNNLREFYLEFANTIDSSINNSNSNNSENAREFTKSIKKLCDNISNVVTRLRQIIPMEGKQSIGTNLSLGLIIGTADGIINIEPFGGNNLHYYRVAPLNILAFADLITSLYEVKTVNGIESLLLKKENFKKFLIKYSNISSQGPPNNLNYSLGGFPLFETKLKTSKLLAVLYLTMKRRIDANAALIKEFQLFKIKKIQRMSIITSNTSKIDSDIQKLLTDANIRILTNPEYDKIKYNTIKAILKYFYDELNKSAKLLITKYSNINNKSSKKSRLSRLSRLSKTSTNSLDGIGLLSTYDQITREIDINYFRQKIQVFMSKLRHIMILGGGRQAWTDKRLLNEYFFMVGILNQFLIRLEYLTTNFAFLSKDEKISLLTKLGLSESIIDSKTNQNNSKNNELFAKAIGTKLLDPNVNNINWWATLEQKFNENNTDRTKVNKLFVLAIVQRKNKDNKNKNPSRISRNQLVLIDLFRAVQIDAKKIIYRTLDRTGKSIADTFSFGTRISDEFVLQKSIEIETVSKQGNNNNGKKVYSDKNAIIELGGLKENDLRILFNMIYQLGDNTTVYTRIKENVFSEKTKLKKINALFLQGNSIQDIEAIIAGNKQHNLYFIPSYMLEDPILLREWCYELLFSQTTSLQQDTSVFNTQIQFPVDRFMFAPTSVEYANLRRIFKILDVEKQKAKVAKETAYKADHSTRNKLSRFTSAASKYLPTPGFRRSFQRDIIDDDRDALTRIQSARTNISSTSKLYSQQINGFISREDIMKMGLLTV